MAALKFSISRFRPSIKRTYSGVFLHPQWKREWKTLGLYSFLGVIDNLKKKKKNHMKIGTFPWFGQKLGEKRAINLCLQDKLSAV